MLNCICRFYLSMSARALEDPSLKYTSVLLGREATNQPLSLNTDIVLCQLLRASRCLQRCVSSLLGCHPTNRLINQSGNNTNHSTLTLFSARCFVSLQRYIGKLLGRPSTNQPTNQPTTTSQHSRCSLPGASCLWLSAEKRRTVPWRRGRGVVCCPPSPPPPPATSPRLSPARTGGVSGSVSRSVGHRWRRIP